MKKILILLITLLCLLSPITIFAENSVILDDQGDLLSDEQETVLKQKMQSVSDKYSLNMVILTTNSTGSKSIEEFADDYYDEHFYDENGFTFAISLMERSIYASGVGTGVDNISDYEIDYIFERMMSDLQNENYNEAFEKYLDSFDYYYSYDDTADIEDYLNNEIPEKKFGIGNIAISGIIGLIASLITSLVLKSQLKSVAPKVTASEYGNNLVITGMSDFYMGSHVSKTPIIRNNNNSSGGSHGNFGSGHSVHISSGGVSHGGHSSHF